MTPLSPTALEAAAVEIYAQEYDRDAYLLAKQDPQIKKLVHAKATAAITAYLAQREKEGFVEVPNSVFAWLFGEAPDADGRWFEPPEIKEGERNKPYWWRSKLRAMLAASQEQNDASE